MAADTTYQGTGLQRRQDGTTALPTGGSLDIESGAALKIAGTQVTASAAAINLAAASLARLGVIPLDLTAARIIASNEIGVVNATDGGAVASDTDPILKRNATTTDKGLHLEWASASVKEIQFPSIVLPADFDHSVAPQVKVLAKMKAASVDTPAITVAAFEGVGGTDLGGATNTLGTTLGVKSRALTALSSGYPGVLSVSLTPGAHNTASNDIYVYAVWLEYTRK